METVGATPLAADLPPYDLRGQQLWLPLEPKPRGLEHPPKRIPVLQNIPVDPSHNLGQYSLPIESHFEGIIYRSTSRDPNSVGLATPIDELTGLPIPIVIFDTDDTKANTKFSDYHHHYHPERDLISSDDAALALRRSRGQYLPRWLHEHYHKFFAGPEFPESRKDTFAAVVLACAGVVPRKAIDFSGFDGPKIVEVWDQRYGRIVESVKHEGEKHGQTSSIYRSQIGMFFANYAIEQSFEEVISERLIDEFLHTKDAERRKTLGNLMLHKAVTLSVEPVIPIHRSLKKESISRKRNTDLLALVKDYFVRSRRPDYYRALDKKLNVA